MYCWLMGVLILLWHHPPSPLIFLTKYDSNYNNDIIIIIVVPYLFHPHSSHIRSPKSCYFISNIDAALSPYTLSRITQPLLFISPHTYNFRPPHHQHPPPLPLPTPPLTPNPTSKSDIFASCNPLLFST